MDKTRKWKMRLIDADELCADRVSNDPVVIAAKCAPTIDAEPVRHGEWIYDPNATDWGIGGYVCSECYTRNKNLPCNEIKNPLMYAGSNFCPHCGARMDGGTKANG